MSDPWKDYDEHKCKSQEDLDDEAERLRLREERLADEADDRRDRERDDAAFEHKYR